MTNHEEEEHLRSDEKPPMILTKEEMRRAMIPLHMRDSCAHLLIPLNKCRMDNSWLPWTCHPEKAAYEKCEHYEYLRRVREAKRIHEQKVLEKEKLKNQTESNL
eukprot:CAMPEP_0182441364 /NCGR_PEP_ID=MMETSP1172-20130603/300_1 /TAXON_ID=708627 /ORGANISM="Timspurckia oligopyrenoides, Strain CCMP3278" /LENGTH=103 /DNA_ID=CAMNT_0024635573 /DNA_START=74 /DNA_END=385 /DNA_ORIENTATION=+